MVVRGRGLDQQQIDDDGCCTGGLEALDGGGERLAHRRHQADGLEARVVDRDDQHAFRRRPRPADIGSGDR